MLNSLALWQILSIIELFIIYRTDSTDSRTFHVFILLSSWIYLHGELDLAGSYSGFSNALKINAFQYIFIRSKP